MNPHEYATIRFALLGLMCLTAAVSIGRSMWMAFHNRNTEDEGVRG